MTDILIRLKNFEDKDAAQKVVDSIEEAGGILFIDKSTGDEVNVTVGDVTVEG
jgi:hypothetical protein